MLWKAPWDHQSIYRSLKLLFSWLLYCAIYNYSELSWERPFELILIIKNHYIHCFSGATFYFRRDLPFPRRVYNQCHRIRQQLCLEVTSGGLFYKLLLKAGSTSKINQIPWEIVQLSLENLQGPVIPFPLGRPLFLCDVNTVMEEKKKKRNS